MNKERIVICRCEDITLQQIHDLIDQGYTTYEDLKRLLRVGMGPCQGTTCGPLIQRELATYLHQPMEQVPIHKVRPLILGVPLKKIAEGDDHES